MSQIIEALTAHFDEHDLSYELVEEENDIPYLLFGFAGDYAEYRCALRVHQENGLAICYALCPIPVPEEKRDAVARFVTLANYGLQFGNFEMDLRDGEVRYKTSVWLGSVPMTEDLIRPLIGVNFTAIDRYMPGLVAVATMDATPESAIATVERGGPPPQAS